MSKISVIVPVYNTADYLEKCLDSIFSQSGVDLEVIAVNDCSTDYATEILERYRPNGLVILDHERNRGLSAARNTGMEVMTGEKFFFLDSDDWLPEGALQAMNQVAESGMDLVIGSYENCYQNHSTTAPARAAIYPTRRSVEDNFFEINFTNATNKLISSKFAGVRFCENLIFEDNLWAMQVYETVESVAVVERATYCRRMRKDSITRSSYSAQKIESLLYIVTTLAASANADKNCRHTAVYMALTLIKNIFMTDFPSDYRKEILRKLFATGVCKMYCNRDVLPPLTGAMSRLLPMRRRWIFELLFRVYKLTNR